MITTQAIVYLFVCSDAHSEVTEFPSVIPLSGSDFKGWSVFSKPTPNSTERVDGFGFVSIPALIPGDVHDDLER
jgi:hypothetical protein